MSRARKSAAASSSGLASALPPAVLNSLVEESIGRQLRELVAGATEVGALFERLAGSTLWPAFRRLPLSVLGNGTGAAAARAPSGRAKAKRQPARPAKPAKGKKFIRRSSTDIAKTVDRVIGFVAKHPGLRSEEIVKQLGGDAKGVADALARLRSEKHVKTQGEKRATRYFPL
jgi:hypothetical protein